MRACLPGVEDIQCDVPLRWQSALQQHAPFFSRFAGQSVRNAAAHILVTLYQWATAPGDRHPWMMVVEGPHGSGKTALLRYLLDEALALDGWTNDDYSDRPQADALAILNEEAARKAQWPDELQLYVCDNADVFAPPSPQGAVALAQTMEKLLRQGEQLPSRVVLVTSSMHDLWLRELQKNARVDVCPLRYISSQERISPRLHPWQVFLRIYEGNAARARLEHSIAALLPREHSAAQEAGVASSTSGRYSILVGNIFDACRGVLSGPITPEWHAWCQEQVAHDRRILAQLEWLALATDGAPQRLARAHTIPWRTDALSLRALGARVALKGSEGFSKYDTEISFATHQAIRGGQLRRFQRTHGRAARLVLE